MPPVGDGRVVAVGAARHGEGCVPGGDVRHRWLDEADEVVQGRHSILVVRDAEEEWHEDLAQGSEVVIFGIAKDGRKFCGRVSEEGRNFLGRHWCNWRFLKHLLRARAWR